MVTGLISCTFCAFKPDVLSRILRTQRVTARDEREELQRNGEEEEGVKKKGGCRWAVSLFSAGARNKFNGPTRGAGPVRKRR